MSEAGPPSGYGGGLSVNSGLVSGTCASRWQRLGTEERVPVEGRRPGFDETAAFDEAAVEAEPNGTQPGVWGFPSSQPVQVRPKGRDERGGRGKGRQRSGNMLGRG
jgi:hypothetical protein